MERKKPRFSMRALRALDGSIRKWEKIVKGTGVDLGVGNCPCCQLYWANDCKNCPIAIFTGKHMCFGTPYGEKGCEKEELAFLRRVRRWYLQFRTVKR